MANICKKSIKLAISLATIVIISNGLSGCGRKGGLELPPSSQIVTTDENGKTVKETPKKVDKPFILDPLL